MAGELQSGDPEWAGPYRLLGRLGSGGMGQVFLGRSAGGRPVAVKVIRADLAGDPGFRARFRQEVAAARKVSGLFTALVVDADLDGQMPWLATAYVAGPSLADAVASHGRLPAGTVLALAAGLAEGLNAIHGAGVVHRDLKPTNVLLADDGPRLIDFGISRAAEASALTHTGMVVGSPGFMSPEQAEGHEVGPPSDMFSLGAVLTFAATGEGPFGTGSTAALIYRVVHAQPSLDQLPDQVRPLIERCLAKDPGERPTAQDVLTQLGGAALTADWLPEQIVGEIPRYTVLDPVPAGVAVAGGLPGPDAGESTLPRSGPAGPPDGPPTVTAVAALPGPGPVSGQSPPGSVTRKRQRHGRRRLVLASVAGVILAAAAAVAVVLAGLPGSPAAGQPGQQTGTTRAASSAGRASRPAASGSASPSGSVSPSAGGTASASASPPGTTAPPANPHPSVTATIPVGTNALWAAVTPDGAHAYVVNLGSNTVSVISTATNTVTATISVPGPYRAAVSPDGSYAYIASCPDSCGKPEGGVAVVSTATNKVVATLDVGSAPFGVAFTPDGRHAYVTDRYASAVSVIDTASRTVIATIPVGVFPTSVAVSPDGRDAYVTNASSSDVSVIDTASNTVIATVVTGAGAFGVAVTPDSRYAYVANLDGNTVSVVDAGSDIVTALIDVGSGPFAVAVTPDGRYAYVTNGNSNTVSVISTASDKVTASIPLASPNGVAFTPDGRYAYVTNRNSGTVSVISTGIS